MSQPTLLGMETEYALGPGPGLGPWDRYRVADAMLASARSTRRPYLPETSNGPGVFLGNGGRFYVDRGGHPEFATPECADPWQVVGYAQAGELLLREVLGEAAAITPMARRTAIFRCAVDYSRLGTTWGCHESYLYRCDPALLQDHMMPHLVSRIIYAGAGGFHPTAPGLEFALSPRGWLLTQAVSLGSTGSRGIFHTKHEPLAGHHWRRLHVICGESLCSERAAVLKLGTTALVLAAIQDGWRPGFQLQLKSPVDALRAFNADPGLRATAELADGRRATALEIQRSLLRQVEECRRKGGLPEWAGDLCRLWRETLDGLSGHDPAILRQLDWGLKYDLYRKRTNASGLDWAAMPVWSNVVRRLERVAGRIFEVQVPRIAELLRDHSQFQKELERVMPVLRGGGMAWSDVRAMIRLRHELLEADMRFGQVEPVGVFDQLAAAGMIGGDAGRPVPDPRRLIQEPPPNGRAKVRGDAVREIWRRGEAGFHRADWQYILRVTTPANHRLDLSDPFCEREAWIGPADLAAVVARVAQAGT